MDFEIIEEIGCGAYGQTFKAMYKNQLVCIKFFKHKWAMEKEAKMLLAAQICPRVPILFDYYSDDDISVIIMELVEGCTLAHFMSSCSPQENRSLMHDLAYQLGLAIQELHDVGIIHNDIKMDNVMVDFDSGKPRIVLIDLGLAMFAGDSPYPYMSPNEIRRYPHLDPSLAHGGRCSQKTDFYSFGMVLQKFFHIVGCSAYSKLAEFLCFKAEGGISLEELLEENCEDCSNLHDYYSYYY